MNPRTAAFTDKVSPFQGLVSGKGMETSKATFTKVKFQSVSIDKKIKKQHIVPAYGFKSNHNKIPSYKHYVSIRRSFLVPDQLYMKGHPDRPDPKSSKEDEERWQQYLDALDAHEGRRDPEASRKAEIARRLYSHIDEMLQEVGLTRGAMIHHLLPSQPQLSANHSVDQVDARLNNSVDREGKNLVPRRNEGLEDDHERIQEFAKAFKKIFKMPIETVLAMHDSTIKTTTDGTKNRSPRSAEKKLHHGHGQTVASVIDDVPRSSPPKSPDEVSPRKVLETYVAEGCLICHVHMCPGVHGEYEDDIKLPLWMHYDYGKSRLDRAMLMTGEPLKEYDEAPCGDFCFTKPGGFAGFSARGTEWDKKDDAYLKTIWNAIWESRPSCVIAKLMIPRRTCQEVSQNTDLKGHGSQTLTVSRFIEE